MTHEEKQQELQKESAARFNHGKLQWSLVDWDCMECMIEPYTVAIKLNWNPTDLKEQIFQSIARILSGESCKYDPCGESLAYCAAYLTNGRTTVDTEFIPVINGDQAPSWACIHFDALEPMVRVLEYGAKKYDRHNWKKGQRVTELCDSAMRHAIALISGEENDSESGISHIGHIMCNVMFIKYNLSYLRNAYDDRHFDENKGIYIDAFGETAAEMAHKWYGSVDPVDGPVLGKVNLIKK